MNNFQLIPFLCLAISLVRCKDVHFSVQEETNENYHVGILSTESTEVNFHKIESPNDGSTFFDVDKNTGEIKIRQKIDREKICPTSVNPYQENFNAKVVDNDCIIRFDVNVIEKTTKNLYDAITVHITINDINDNACYFEPSHQIIEIDENEKPGEAKIQINLPKDPDSDRLGYGIIKENIRLLDNDYFVLEPIRNEDKRLYLTLSRSVDYESVKEVNLKIENSNYNDKGCSLELIVKIRDINDNHPMFDKRKYSLELTEDTPVDTVLLTLDAHDEDVSENGRIIYEIDNLVSNPEYKKYVRIDQDNGSIILQKKFNYNDVKELKFFVNAKNPKEPKILSEDPSLSVAEVVIRISDINDHAPVIRVLSILNNNHNLTVEEEIDSSTKKDIALISVSDEDAGINAKVECSLKDLSKKNCLNLVEVNEKTYKIVIVKRIDREELSKIHYEIECRDSGHPVLSTKFQGFITVLDVNDNSPEFIKSDYLIEVLEDTADERKRVEFEISNFYAVDKDTENNGNVEYSILDRNTEAASFFTIDRNTGKLFSQGNLDRELIDTFKFKVQAKDDGVKSLSSTTDVTIKILDFNDNRPKFDQDFYLFEIPEHSPQMKFVGSVFVEDKDLDESGRINVDFKRMMGQESSMILKIIRDPFTNDYIHAKEVEEKASSYFKLNSTRTGPGSIRVDLYLTKDIDRERFYQLFKDYDSPIDTVKTKPLIEFELVAKDSGKPQLESTVQIKVEILDLNDNAPIWKFPSDDGSMNMTEFSVSIDEAPGYAFAYMETEDLDAGENGTVKYKIIDGNTQGFFDINEINGQISLAPQNGYSSLAKILYPLTIRASDSSHVNPHFRDIRIGIKVDNSEPKSFYYSKSNANRKINFLIIIAIVTASFIVSTVLLTSICIVLKKAKNDSHLSGRQNTFKTNGFYEVQKNPAPSIGSNHHRNDESSLLYFSGNGKIFSQENSEYGISESNYCQQNRMIGYPCSPDGTIINSPGTFTMKEPANDPRYHLPYNKPDVYGSYSTASLASPCNSMSWAKNLSKMNQINIDKLYEDHDSGNGDSLETAITSKPNSLIQCSNQIKLSNYPQEHGMYFSGNNHALSQSILELNADPVMRFINDPNTDGSNKCATLTSSFV